MKKHKLYSRDIGLGALAAAIGLISAGAAADTFTVDTLSAVPVDGKTTLADAINDANNHAGPDTIVFASNLSGTINLRGSMLPGIHESVYIHGPGKDKLTINGGGAYVAFYGTLRNGNSYVAIDNLSITNTTYRGVTFTFYGSNNGLSLSSASLSGNTGGAVLAKFLGSGGKYNKHGVSIDHSVISGNGGVNAAAGGGIYVSNGYLDIRYSRITNNKARYAGGGVAIQSDHGKYDLKINNTVLSGNVAGVDKAGYSLGPDGAPGGAVSVSSSSSYYISLDIFQSELSGNTSVGRGGAIAVNGGKYVDIAATILSGNAVTANVYNSMVTGNGGAIAARKVAKYQLKIDNSLIQNNTAATGGGAIYSTNSVYIDGSRITGNKAGGSSTNYNTGLVGGAIFLNRIDNSYTYKSYLRITNSTISGNQALAGTSTHGQNIVSGSGGALAVRDASGHSYGKVGIHVAYTTLSGNSASGRGGALAFVDHGHKSGRLYLSNSTLTDNSANMNGAMAAIGYISTEMQSATISGNSGKVGGAAAYYAQVSIYSGQQHIDDTVIHGANNGSLDLGIHTYAAAPYVTSSFVGSMVAEGDAFSAGSSTANTADPKLGGLVHVGGFSSVLVPGAASPLIDAGDVAGGPIDQRHMKRVDTASGLQDIGAVEVSATQAPVPVNLDSLRKQLSQTPLSVISGLDARQFFKDPDGTPITNVYFTGLPAGLSADHYGVVSGQIAREGSFFVTALAVDYQGDSSAFQFVVSNKPHNIDVSSTGSVGLAWLGLLAFVGRLRRSR